MTSAIGLGGDVIAGASALAGLFLVYLGNVAIGFDGYDTLQKPSVRSRFQIRAWLAFAGIVFAVFSVALALVGKWTANGLLADDAAALLLLALVWAVGIALIAALDVR